LSFDREANNLALLDPLTKVGNRRGLEMKLNARLSEVKNYNRSCGILFVDIDLFKGINDTYGHITGDEVLKMIARTISHSVRPFDIVGRWGGEEFIALIADVDEKTLSSIAERARRLVEQSKLPEAFNTISVTVSIGATLARKDDDIHTLIERVDRAMNTCKARGRNQVVTSL
jgi:diguanylate cyclase (GGDEF)-like protein